MGERFADGRFRGERISPGLPGAFQEPANLLFVDGGEVEVGDRFTFEGDGAQDAFPAEKLDETRVDAVAEKFLGGFEATPPELNRNLADEFFHRRVALGIIAALDEGETVDGVVRSAVELVFRGGNTLVVGRSVVVGEES